MSIAILFFFFFFFGAWVKTVSPNKGAEEDILEQGHTVVATCQIEHRAVLEKTWK